MNAKADGLNMQPRIGEPESVMLPGMASPLSREAVETLLGVGPLAMPDTSGPPPVALQQPAYWVYDFDPANGSSRATYNGEVSFTSGGSATAGVTTWNGRTGAVTLTTADITGAGGAPLNSPTFINGNANTPAPGDSTTKLATTMFVSQAIAANPAVSSFNGRTGAVGLTLGDVTGAGAAPANSPALTGVPTAPTPTQGDHSSNIATTQFVSNALASGAVTSFNGRQGSVALTLSDVQSVGGAPIASPNFTGVPSGTTASPGTATTQLATCAFVTNAVVAATSGVASFNGRSGTVTLQTADVSGVGGALLAGPAFSGNPTAPTPLPADSSTKIATTAFVANAIANAPAGVVSFNGRTGSVALTSADVYSVGGAPIASPTFTGAPQAPAAAPSSNDNSIANTAWVNTAIASKPSLIVSDAAPATPVDNAMWWQSNTGYLFLRYNDGNSSQWVQLNSIPGAGSFLKKQGVTDGSYDSAGQIGEVISSNIIAPGITLSSGVFTNITSIVLPAGDWDVMGEVWLAVGTGGSTGSHAFINTVSGSVPANSSLATARNTLNLTYGASMLQNLALRPCRASLSASITYYLIGCLTFPSGTCTAYGNIWARRTR